MVGVGSPTRVENPISTVPGTEELVINMGPQHPSTHGVLRVILKLDGETVKDVDCDIGYLHRGTEKIGENITYTMFIPYTDRLDYIAAPSSNLAWVQAVESLFDWEIPLRALFIRTLVAELSRCAPSAGSCPSPRCSSGSIPAPPSSRLRPPICIRPMKAMR